MNEPVEARYLPRGTDADVVSAMVMLSREVRKM